MKFPGLFGSSAEEHVNPVESYRAAANNRAGRYCAPEYVGARKLPNCEERRKNRHEDARAGYPERNTSDHAGVKEATSWLALLRGLQFILYR
ncbi:MAG: hypothetical protein ABR556_00275 [Pyrinomonadaceae bacterium]